MQQQSQDQVSDLQWRDSQQLPLQKQPDGPIWTGPAAGAVPQQQPDLALATLTGPVVGAVPKQQPGLPLATMRLGHKHLAETAGHHQQHEEMRAFECLLRAEEEGTDSASVTVYGWSPTGFVPAQSVAGKEDWEWSKGTAGKADLEALKGLAGKGELELKGAGSRRCLE